MHHILVDLGFGDSGKGAIADRLAAQDPKNTVVIRYTGGSQAGHNVVIGDKSHVHSSFASGALGGIRSHMSAFCPINPHNLIREAMVLSRANGLPTRSYCSIDPLCPLITGPDRAFNRRLATTSGRKNTVGLGIGRAMRRHETSPHRIFAADLLYPDLYRHKLDQIIEWYRKKYGFAFEPEPNDYGFPDIFEFVEPIPTSEVIDLGRTIIFEGAQGVMLDRDHGFFPDVTYGYTTMRNALELLPADQQAELHYITRSYCTRHGDGPMGNGAQLNLSDATNHDDGFQGKFRSAELDWGLLKYALRVNDAYSDWRIARQVINFTCCDRHEANLSPIHSIFNERYRRVQWFGADRNSECKFF